VDGVQRVTELDVLRIQTVEPFQTGRTGFKEKGLEVLKQEFPARV
jgi:hypothetical protein